MVDNISFGFERRFTPREASGLDHRRLYTLASLRLARTVEEAPGLPMGVDPDEPLEAWRADGALWTGVAWVTSSGDVVVFGSDEATPSNYTIQGGFELDDTVSAAARTHVCRGDDCWGCSIDAA